jgi:hypothetical protein
MNHRMSDYEMRVVLGAVLEYLLLSLWKNCCTGDQVEAFHDNWKTQDGDVKVRNILFGWSPGGATTWLDLAREMPWWKALVARFPKLTIEVAASKAHVTSDEFSKHFKSSVQGTTESIRSVFKQIVTGGEGGAVFFSVCVPGDVVVGHIVLNMVRQVEASHRLK